METLVAESRVRVKTGLGRGELVNLVTLASAFGMITAAIVVWLPNDHRAPSLLTVCALVVGYAIAARVQFEAGFGYAVPTQLILIPMLFIAPVRLVPLLVALGYLVSKLPEHVRGDWHPARTVAHLVSAFYAVGPVLVLAFAGSPRPSLREFPLVVIAIAAQFSVDFVVSAIRARSLGVSCQETFAALKPAWLVDAALTPIGFALAAFAANEPLAFLLGVPLMGLLAYFARERRARIDHALELSHAYRGTALLLGDMVEADDEYTGLHSQDVVGLVLAVSEVLGLDEAARRAAEMTALLHDVGKVRVPKEIIRKRGALTPQEREIMNRHTVDGQRLLERVGGLLGEIGKLVRSCHEHWDGSGYPDALRGEAIPLISRIVCASDAFSAMTTDRTYRRAMTVDAALAELQRCAGTQFDPRVVAAIAVAVPRLDRSTQSEVAAKAA